LTAVSCQSAYYGAMEKFGYEKRDILLQRVDNARDAQQEAKQQFESALAQFISVANFSGGELEQQYDKLKTAFEQSEQRADAVRARVDEVERVADDLFEEWNAELKQYTDAEMRRGSQRQLEATRARYKTLIAAMTRAEGKLDPVLGAYRDRVLFLKHNLNARAIASLRTERSKVEANIGALVVEMNRSIDAANTFIKDMAADKG
jgi:hypothetical protein